MKIKELLLDFILLFLIAFITVSAVTFLFNILIHNLNEVDWATSVRLAIIFGIFFPRLHYRERGQKAQ